MKVTKINFATEYDGYTTCHLEVKAKETPWKCLHDLMRYTMKQGEEYLGLGDMRIVSSGTRVPAESAELIYTGTFTDRPIEATS